MFTQNFSSILRVKLKKLRSSLSFFLYHLISTAMLSLLPSTRRLPGLLWTAQLFLPPQGSSRTCPSVLSSSMYALPGVSILVSKIQKHHRAADPLYFIYKFCLCVSNNPSTHRRLCHVLWKAVSWVWHGHCLEFLSALIKHKRPTLVLAHQCSVVTEGWEHVHRAPFLGYVDSECFLRWRDFLSTISPWGYGCWEIFSSVWLLIQLFLWIAPHPRSCK